MAGIPAARLESAVRTPLFSDFSEEEADAFIRAQGGELLRFPAGSVITETAEPAPPERLLLILEGVVHLVRYGVHGDRYMIDYTLAGGVVGSMDDAGEMRIHSSIFLAGSACTLLQLSARRAPGTPPVLWLRFTQGLLRTASRKNARLMQKADIISRRTVREKLRAFLSYEQQIHGGSVFDIPLSRQELADYICIDRTTLSTELSRMAAEGLLHTRRSHFELSGDWSQVES